MSSGNKKENKKSKEKIKESKKSKETLKEVKKSKEKSKGKQRKKIRKMNRLLCVGGGSLGVWFLLDSIERIRGYF